MNFEMDISSAIQYKSKAQKARVLTENWVQKNIVCPGCGTGLLRYANNSPVADFCCSVCVEDYELKATSGILGKMIPDGAYGTMMTRLAAHTNPNLLLLQYDAAYRAVKNLLAIPRYYFTPNIIQKRSPLSLTAKRAGWIGCNILIGEIPAAGQIKIINDQVYEPLKTIQHSWEKTKFLKEINKTDAKGWLLQTMRCIDKIRKREFGLNDIYRYETLLREMFPNNKHIRPKMRQQLQILRDKGYLAFIGNGSYRIS